MWIKTVLLFNHKQEFYWVNFTIQESDCQMKKTQSIFFFYIFWKQAALHIGNLAPFLSSVQWWVTTLWKKSIFFFARKKVIVTSKISLELEAETWVLK